VADRSASPGTARPAFYALRGGGWRDFWTVLHPPYTIWHLSYVALGWAVSPASHESRLAGALAAFGLAVGIGAHALDERNGRPLRTKIPDQVLVALAVVSIGLACAIGVYGAATISWWLLAFVAFGGFIVCAYNLEWFDGRFHTDLWFALSWGAFPAITAAFANAERLTIEAVFVAAGCFALSAAQRTLSTPARALRRSTRRVEGVIERTDGTIEQIDANRLRATPEAALRWMSLAMPLIAVAVVIVRQR